MRRAHASYEQIVPVERGLQVTVNEANRLEATMASADSKTTTKHEVIRKWTEARGGRPATVKGTGGKADPGVIRIDFPGYGDDDSLEEISWDEWFEKFDQSKLAFLYQEETKDGEQSTFNKLVDRVAGAKR
jgi:hypothetical protein